MVHESILVTGAVGQVGSDVTLALRERFGGERVVAAGHRKEPDDELRDSGPFIFLDVMKKEDVRAVIKEHGIDTIYHMGSLLSAVGEKHPDLAWDVNMTGLKNVLDVSRELGVQRIFWPSSIAAFGPSTPKDNTPQFTVMDPNTMYGVTKVAGELLCGYYWEKYGLDIRGLRYPGLISYRTAPGGGTTDYAVEIFYEALRNRSYVSFLDRDTVLPMMYMPDAIRSTIDLMEAPSENVKIHTSYNITAMSFSAAELVEEITKHIPDFKCSYEPDFRQKIAESWPKRIDDSRARQDWGWKEEFGVPEMVEDMLKNLSRILKIDY